MYFLRRLAFSIPLLLVISALAFVLVRLAPGGPFDRDRAPASPEIEANLRAKYHLDEPIWKQYARYVGDLAHGDFGVSLKYRNHTVNDIIAQEAGQQRRLRVLPQSSRRGPARRDTRLRHVDRPGERQPGERRRRAGVAFRQPGRAA